MKYFSIPADFKKETIDECVKLNKIYDDSKVIETYGNITIGNLFGCGRSVSELPKVDFPALAGFVRYSKKNNIDFNYTLNTPHMQNREFSEKGIIELKEFLIKLYEIGIRNLTVTLPSLIDLIVSMKLDFKIKASAICSIDNANKALAFRKIGADKIVVYELINRDFNILKRIRKVFGENVEIIVNSPCHIDCTYRMSHYNQQSSDSISSTNPISFNYYEHKCMLRRYSQLVNWLKICWVRPEDLKYYTGIGIKYFKIQGRQTILKGGNIVKVIDAYFREDFDGDLVDLINSFTKMNSFKVFVDNKKLNGFLKPFVENGGFCIRDCTECDYCDVFAKKCLDSKEARDVSQSAVKFYQEYDKYSQLINNIKVEGKKTVEDINQNDNGEETFNF